MISFFLFAVISSWLPSGGDFRSEALEFMRIPEDKGIPLFDEYSFQKAEAQREELRKDARDWEGVIADVLDPKNNLKGNSAALSILQVRDSFGDKRVTRSLQLLLDKHAALASENPDDGSSNSGKVSKFRSLVGKISEYGSPDLIRFVCEKILEDESLYYPLFNETTFRLFFERIAARGSELNLPSLKKLEKKLEADDRIESAERARIASISIKRREQSRKGKSTSKNPPVGNNTNETEILDDTLSEHGEIPKYVVVFAVLAITIMTAGAVLVLKRR